MRSQGSALGSVDPVETSPVSKLVAKGDPVFLDQYLIREVKVSLK